MDEVDSGLIRTGLRAKITLDPFPGRTLGGSVTRVAPYVLDVESQNRTVEIEVELEDEEFSSKLLPGTSADVEVVLEVRIDVLRVPTSAILEGGRVLVLDGGTLVERHIEAGVRNWELTEVSSGLDEGDKVVVSLERAEVRAGAAAVEEDQQARP
jgi:HlyD family secretion protein